MTSNHVDLFLLRYYSSLEVASEYFRSGADKISIGSDAVFAAEAYLQTGVCILFSLQSSAISPLHSYLCVSGKNGEKQLGANF